MSHFTGINEAPPPHQLRSLRRHGANKHSQFKRAQDKSSTKGGPWSRATAVPCAPSTPPQSNRVHFTPLCHGNDIESANIKNLICQYSDQTASLKVKDHFASATRKHLSKYQQRRQLFILFRASVLYCFVGRLEYYLI